MMRRAFIHSTILLLCCQQSAISQARMAQLIDTSLRKMFGNSISSSHSTVVLSGDETKLIFDQSQSRWASDTISVYACYLDTIVAGYGFVDDVKGKTQMITYLVGVQPDGKVRDVDVLAYRESQGGEIAYESFRKQYRNKTSSDKFLPGRNIKNISGATISVRSLSLGVQRVLSTFDVIKSRIRH